jgi:hypothetical protein
MATDGGDKWGWVATVVATVTTALAGLWAAVWKVKGDREKTVIDQYRQLIADQKAENIQMRETLKLHATNSDAQQALIDDLYVRDRRCQIEMARLWVRVCEAGLDLGPMPESLMVVEKEKTTDYRMNTAKQNAALLKNLDSAHASHGTGNTVNPPPKPEEGRGTGGLDEGAGV